MMTPLSEPLAPTLTSIWAEVLELPAVGPDDDFFEQGGDSLSAIQVLSRIEVRWGVRLPLETFFANPTPARLAGVLAETTAALAVPAAPTALDQADRDRFPATSAQARLWFLDQFIADRQAYNVYRLVRVQGDLDPAALGEALAELTTRHETLRTRIVSEGGVPVQIVDTAREIALPVVDLTGDRSSAEALAEATRQAAAEAARPFNLADGPLWRPRLWCVGPDDFLFLVVMHHTISDGWSMGTFFRDLSVLYEAAEKGGAPAPLAPLPLQYGEYALAQHAWADSPAYREQLDFWKRVLAPPVGTLQLPVSRPRPRQQTFRGACHCFDWPDALVRQVDELARRAGATRYQVSLAAFQALLFRYSGQEDLLIGTPVANRNRPELEQLVGFFVNTLILRTHLGGDPSFRDLLGRVRSVTLGAFGHQEMPLETLVEELRPQRDPSRQPFFQVMFLYQNFAGIPAQLYRHRLTPVPIHNGTAIFDLRLVLEDKPGGGLWAWIEYNTDLFDAGSVERLAGHYQALLAGACAAPETPVSELPLLTPPEFQQLVFDWNSTARSYPDSICIQELFEGQVNQRPDAIAVVAGGREWTYRQLDDRANRVARYLRAHGVEPGRFVGVCLKRSVDTLTAVLAVLKAGGAYVPLDPAYPKERLAFMLDDTKAPLVLTEQALVPQLPEGASRYVCLDRLDGELRSLSAEQLDRRNGPDDLAYVIYTSGSTGRPKGVVLRHRPVANVLDWVNMTFGVGPADRILFVTSLSFDLSVYDIFGVLGAGGSVRIADEEDLRDPARLLRVLRTESITIWDSAPAALQQLVPFFASATAGRKPAVAAEHDTLRSPGAGMRLVMLSGDWIPVPLPDQVRSTFPNANVVSLGGATEAAIWSNWYPVSVVDPSWPSIPYGKPIRNARYHILDRRLQPVPVGVPGELHIGGPVLADGYLNRPELTAERFIADPFVARQPTPPAPPPEAGRGEPAVTGTASETGHLAPSSSSPRNGEGSRLYKTGDLARYLPDGNIEFLGRIDQQVKVRGFRVELGEIEAILGQHPALQDAVVRPHRDAGGHIYLAAYVVRRPGPVPPPAELTKYLQTKLPEYMVPAHFVYLEALPLTPNGKLDRAALAPPDLVAAKPEEGYVGPEGDAERDLQTVWEEVLKIHPIGVTDNFYDLGGHSLLAAVLMARIEAKLGHRLPLETLFTAPTVRDLANVIQRKLELGHGCLVSLQTEGRNPPLFLIAGAGGHVFAFHKFARLLGPDQPTYGMKAVGVDGSEPPLERIEDIAARYVKEILTVRPEGPYVLGGYSVGALIAFELALQLRALGKEVPRVIAFDMLAPGYPRKLPLYRRVFVHLQNFLRSPRAQKQAYLKDRYESMRGRVLRWLNLHRLEAPDVPGMEIVSQDNLKRVWGGLTKARDRYWPAGCYDGKVVLIGSHREWDWAGCVFDDRLRGWTRWAEGGVDRFDVPATHLEIFHDQNLDLLVRTVRQVIAEVAPAAAASPAPAEALAVS